MSAAPSGSSASAVVDMLRSDGLTAQLLDSTGTPMHFYGIKEEDHLVTAYVEATEGEQFSIKLNCVDHSRDYSADVYLGGQRFKIQGCLPKHWPSIIKSRSISQTEAQTLMFSKAVLTDDEANSIRDPAEVARLGEICITMHKVKSRWRVEPEYSANAIGPQQAIHERAKKVGAIQLAAGPIVQASKSLSSRSTYDAKVPPVVFKVQCTTRTGLQLLRYIPMEEDRVGISRPTKKRAREEEELKAESQRLKNQLDEIEKRRRVLVDADGSRNAGSSTQAGEASSSVKRERTKFDFSRGGTSNDPLTIAEASSSVKRERTKFDFSHGGTANDPLTIADLSD